MIYDYFRNRLLLLNLYTHNFLIAHYLNIQGKVKRLQNDYVASDKCHVIGLGYSPDDPVLLALQIFLWGDNAWSSNDPGLLAKIKTLLNDSMRLEQLRTKFADYG